jgi:hypothetical protein
MEITIPTKWSDVTIGNYINLRPVLNSKLNPIERVINILAVLTGQKRDVIKNISLKQYKSIKKKMSFLETELPKQLKDKRFKIGGQWYEFKVDAKKLLFGEYINSMEILQNSKDDEEAIFNNLHHILTTICRPVKKTIFGWKHIKVDSEILRKTADNFLNNMPMTIAYPIGVFFYTHSEDLTKAIKTCLIQEAEKMTNEAKQEMDLVNDGDGGTP